MAKINVLNNDCLFEVFSWLSLSEKCGVQRVKRKWKRINDDMISGEDTLELFMGNPAPYGKQRGFPNAYYPADLEHFFKTGALNNIFKVFLRKFVGTRSVSRTGMLKAFFRKFVEGTLLALEQLQPKLI